MGEMHLTGGYMTQAYLSNSELAAAARLSIPSDVKYDTMVGTGLSGSIVIPRLATALRKKWLIIRKENDGSHSDQMAEGILGHRWIFVDDFIDTGATFRRVLGAMDKILTDTDINWRDHESRYVGRYEYSRKHWTEPTCDDTVYAKYLDTKKN